MTQTENFLSALAEASAMSAKALLKQKLLQEFLILPQFSWRSLAASLLHEARSDWIRLGRAMISRLRIMRRQRSPLVFH
ncbi:hypothetical protein P7F60_11485 [Rhizobium sp. YJ-22]|uniref:hypothetical protein n=1 Tax=Rhizobium sp. YJ-22 TaxID=3037556 RepID=UPI002412B492|nr:hypothetical protein [Rhizobium sp. YJ-22]MDG3577014.1 hypothetical protein [Rhizobium sp. YJ-22]